MISERHVDVLVIGGGLAGLQAALSAREAGASVAVCAKGHPGRSGSSATTSAGYASVMPEWLNGDDPSIHFDDTMRGGGDIADPQLVRILCDEGPVLAERLAERGGRFRRENGHYSRTASGDHTHPRSLGAQHRIGVDYTEPLAQLAQQLGVDFWSNTQVCEIVVDAGDVCGAVAFDSAANHLSAISSPAVVVAAGGLGQLYPVTSNPRDVTGDGFMLALRAGAALRDLEFIQFYPWRCIDPFPNRVSFQPATWTVGARMLNAAGERFMADYDAQRMEATTRDIAARAIFDQVRRGLGIGGGVRVDLSQVSEPDLRQTNPKILEGLQRRGLDYRTYPLIAAPEAHYAMGGIAIDAHGASNIPGLFAAGESAGGIQGANRLSNNALPEALVFGHRAGEVAAGRGYPPKGRSATVVHASKRWVDTLHAEETHDHGEAKHLRTQLQDLAWRALGIVRNRGDLHAGIEALHHWRTQAGALNTPRTRLSRPALELENLADVAEVAMVSAMRRTETRGAHVREDHPQRDDAWRGSVFVHRQPDGSLTHRFRPAPATEALQ